MHKIKTFTFLICAFLMLVNKAANASDNCDKLDGAKKQLAQKILESNHLYDYCDDTIANCLKKSNSPALAKRLEQSVCYWVEKGEDEAKITRRLQRRARSMMGSVQKGEVSAQNHPRIGKQGAPVTVVVYACATCPYCARFVPQLQRAVVSGPLQGKVEFVFKPFPLRGHNLSTEAGLAMVAAHQQNRYWDYINLMYKESKQLSEAKLVEWAKTLNMDVKAFEASIKSRETRNTLIEYKKSGVVAKVEATPQLYINGRRYVGFLELEEVIDVLEEAYEKFK